MNRRLGAAEPISALNRVRLIESGEPLLDLRKEIPDLQILRETAVPWARRSICAMLQNARRLLPAGYDLGLREAWRSTARQKLIYNTRFEKLKEDFPQYGYPTLRRMTNRFVAPYDQKAPPGHSTGGAVDVWLMKGGEPVSLDGPGERFLTAPTFARGLPPEVRKLRMALLDAMVTAGFTNCRDEWWHYSYGDAAWAVRLGRDTCVYGAASPPAVEFEEKDRLFEQEFLKRLK